MDVEQTANRFEELAVKLKPKMPLYLKLFGAVLVLAGLFGSWLISISLFGAIFVIGLIVVVLGFQWKNVIDGENVTNTTVEKK